MTALPARAEAASVLVVADDDAGAAAVRGLLAAEFGSRLELSTPPANPRAAVAAGRVGVVVLALASLDAAERTALALGSAAAGAAPVVVIALVDSGQLAAAARFCRDGVFDDYVQHFPTPIDRARLATSVRLALRGRAAPTAPITRSGRARPLVLVVEDDEFSHQLLASMLDTENLDLVFEPDGTVAIERIRSAGPDLVLMDINLPGSNGVDLTQRLKSEPGLAAIPVVMVTGEARRETLIRSMEAGAADFIVKPFSRDALVAKIGRYLPAS